MDELSKSKQEISQMLAMVTKFQNIVESKDKQIQMLEDKIDQLEQYTRQENIIITDLKTSHKPWSRRVTYNDANCDGENAPHEELERLENQVIGYFNTSLNVNIKACSACHTLNGDKKRTYNTPKIIVRFVNRKKENRTAKKIK